jgi:hypothetical protein
MVDMQMNGVEVPKHHLVALRGRALGEYPKLVNGDDFAAVWKHEHTLQYYDAIRACGLVINEAKQGISQSSVMFSEVLLNFRYDDKFDQKGRLRVSLLKCTPVDRIPLSRITLAKESRDKRMSGKGLKLQSIAETVNVTHLAFEGFRRKAIIRSIYLFNEAHLKKAEAAKIPLYWPTALGGAGFIDRRPTAPTNYLKAAAVILTGGDRLRRDTFQKMESAWEVAIPSQMGRSAAVVGRKALEFVERMSEDLDRVYAEFIDFLQDHDFTEPIKRHKASDDNPYTSTPFSWEDAIENTKCPDEIRDRIRRSISEKLPDSEYSDSFKTKVLTSQIFFEAMQSTLDDTAVITAKQSRKTVQRYLTSHINPLVARDMSLSKISKTKERSLASVSARIRKVVRSTSKLWGSVQPVDPEKAIALLDTLDSAPSLLSGPALKFEQALRRTTAPRASW